MNTLVSVIIPTRNRASLLQRAIESITQQTMQDFEIIVINDASTDETALMLKQFPKVTVITHEKPMGGSQSRNHGIEKSKGKWIAFLDDDDLWHPDKLSRQLRVLKDNPNAIACTSGYRIHYPFGLKRDILPKMTITLPALLQSNSLGGASVCICKSSVLKEIGGFDRRLRSSQDWDLWIKLCMQGEIVSADVVLVDYFVHFNYRISNDMQAKYLGARNFYFKYRNRMNKQARIRNLAFICYIKSRQSNKKIVSRLRYLYLALSLSEKKTGMSYFVSCFPRIILHCFSKTKLSVK